MAKKTTGLLLSLRRWAQNHWLTGELREWSIYEPHRDGRLIAAGLIFHDRKKRYQDGTFIFTSYIEYHDQKTNVIFTRNSSYKLVGAPYRLQLYYGDTKVE